MVGFAEYINDITPAVIGAENDVPETDAYVPPLAVV